MEEQAQSLIDQTSKIFSLFNFFVLNLQFALNEMHDMTSFQLILLILLVVSKTIYLLFCSQSI